MPAESLEDRIKELEKKIRNIEDEKLEDIEKKIESLDRKLDKEIEEIDKGNQEEFKISWRAIDRNLEKLEKVETSINFLFDLIEEKLHPGEVDNFTRHLENNQGFPRDEEELSDVDDLDDY